MALRQQLANVQELRSFSGEGDGTKLHTVAVTATHAPTSRRYSLRFVFGDTEIPFIWIDTEKREDYLKRGTEGEAEARLVELSLGIRRITGGRFEIHPSFGAVLGSKAPKIDPTFLVGSQRNDETLAMIINLYDEVKSGPATKRMTGGSATTLAMAMIPMIPGAVVAMVYISEMQKHTGGFIGEMQKFPDNFTQQNRHQAYANGFGKAFDVEYARFNLEGSGLSRLLRGKQRILAAIDATPANIADTLERFESKLSLRIIGLNIIKD